MSTVVYQVHSVHFFVAAFRIAGDTEFLRALSGLRQFHQKKPRPELVVGVASQFSDFEIRWL